MRLPLNYTDSHVGKLTTRIYSGVLQAGTYLYNPRQNTRERVGRVLLMHANNREEIDKDMGELSRLLGRRLQRQAIHW